MDDLIQRARNGDGEAFAALFEYGKQPLWRAAMAVLGNVDDASDALQETAVKAWRAMPRFGGRSAVNTWFMRILLRVCYDMRRQRNRETPCAMGLFAADVDGSGVWWEPSVDQMLAGAGVSLAVRALWGLELDVWQYVGIAGLLVLFYVNDFPVRQISQIMNVSEGAVRTRLSRARDRFKVAYSQGSNEEVEVAR